MKRNIGSMDNGLRIMIGAALTGAAIVETLPAWGYIGVVPLLSAVIWTCPLYTLLKCTTTKAHIPEPEWYRTVRRTDPDMDFDTKTIPHF